MESSFLVWRKNYPDKTFDDFRNEIGVDKMELTGGIATIKGRSLRLKIRSWIKALANLGVKSRTKE